MARTASLFTLLLVLALTSAGFAGDDERKAGQDQAGKVGEIPTGVIGVGAMVEMRVFEIPANVPIAETLTLWHDALGVPSPGRRKYVAPIDAATAARVQARAERIGTQRLLTRTWVLDGQPAILYEMYEEAYVQDYDVEIENAGEYLGDPITGTLREGVSLAVQAEVSGDRRRLRFHGRFSAVVRPIEVFKVKNDRFREEVEIQMPELRIMGLDETHDSEGQDTFFLVGTPVIYSDVKATRSTTRVVLIRVQRTTLQALELEGLPDDSAGR